MNTTTCTPCRGTGRVPARGYNCKTVCPTCSGVGKLATPTPNTPARVNRPPVLARFAGSLTGMAGGTVIREEPCPANQLPEKP